MNLGSNDTLRRNLRRRIVKNLHDMAGKTHGALPMKDRAGRLALFKTSLGHYAQAS